MIIWVHKILLNLFPVFKIEVDCLSQIRSGKLPEQWPLFFIVGVEIIKTIEVQVTELCKEAFVAIVTTKSL